MSHCLVIFFHPNFSDGGVERTNIILAKGLIASGYKMMFLTTEATDHFAEEIKEAAIELKLLGSGSVSKHFFAITRVLRSASATYKHVYFIGCQYYVNIVSMAISFLLGSGRGNVSFINSERNHIDEFSYRHGFKNKLILLSVKLMYRYADVVVANSQQTAIDLEEYIGRKVLSVYNPTINDRIELLRQESVTEHWFLEDMRPCIISVGRLSFQKDFVTLLRSFLQVRQVIDSKLVILGEGDERASLMAFIDENALSKDVYLPGFVANPYKFMQASNLFVLSSRYEGLPNVLIEAIYLGLPCVSTRCKSGPSEILLDGKGGRLVPVGDHDSMAAAIINAFQNTEENVAMHSHAYIGLQRFKPEVVNPLFEQAINCNVRGVS
jgi:glycosyltransferase involved in cell wall biosynthesis